MDGRRVALLLVVSGLTLRCGGKSVQQKDDEASSGGSRAITSSTGGDGGTRGELGGSGGTGARGGGGNDSVGGTGGWDTMGVTTANLPTRASAGGSGTSGGSTGSAREGVIGERCESVADCSSNLDCLMANGSPFGSGGPAHGICSLACAPGGIDCEAYDEDSTCVEFGSDIAYCMRRCTTGLEADKCLGRQDTICDVAACALDYGEPCDDDGCAVFRCDPGGSQATVCLPHCNADSDCPDGRFCDPRRGVCADEPSSDKRFGESCTPGADECAGFCDPDTEVCFEACALGTYPSCASESASEGDAACLLAAGNADFLDASMCTKLCDCSSDCFGGVDCIAFEDQSGAFEVLGRPGICLDAVPSDTRLTECP